MFCDQVFFSHCFSETVATPIAPLLPLLLSVIRSVTWSAAAVVEEVMQAVTMVSVPVVTMRERWRCCPRWERRIGVVLQRKSAANAAPHLPLLTPASPSSARHLRSPRTKMSRWEFRCRTGSCLHQEHRSTSSKMTPQRSKRSAKNRNRNRKCSCWDPSLRHLKTWIKTRLRLFLIIIIIRLHPQQSLTLCRSFTRWVGWMCSTGLAWLRLWALAILRQRRIVTVFLTPPSLGTLFVRHIGIWTSSGEWTSKSGLRQETGSRGSTRRNGTTGNGNHMSTHTKTTWWKCAESRSEWGSRLRNESDYTCEMNWTARDFISSISLRWRGTYLTCPLFCLI